MKITEEMVDYVSALARLNLPREEKSTMVQELERILDYMDVLTQVDTAGVEPMSHVVPLKNVTRPDKAAPSMSKADLFSGAPVPDEDAFLVPKAVESDG